MVIDDIFSFLAWLAASLVEFFVRMRRLIQETNTHVNSHEGRYPFVRLLLVIILFAYTFVASFLFLEYCGVQTNNEEIGVVGLSNVMVVEDSFVNTRMYQFGPRASFQKNDDIERLDFVSAILRCIHGIETLV